MKRLIVLTAIVGLMAGLAFADNPAPAPSRKKGSGPCAQIIAACKAAGFVKGEWKEGKGLYKDCLDPILAGKSVEGVSIDPSVAQACNQVRANRRKEHGSEGQNKPE